MSEPAREPRPSEKFAAAVLVALAVAVLMLLAPGAWNYGAGRGWVSPRIRPPVRSQPGHATRRPYASLYEEFLLRSADLGYRHRPHRPRIRPQAGVQRPAAAPPRADGP